MFRTEAEAIAAAQVWSNKLGLPVTVFEIEGVGFVYLRQTKPGNMPDKPSKLSLIALVWPRGLPQSAPQRGQVSHTANIIGRAATNAEALMWKKRARLSLVLFSLTSCAPGSMQDDLRLCLANQVPGYHCWVTVRQDGFDYRAEMRP